ncbi:hypothetical protein LX64_04771 [Chitinophaga skermanii]|uniref:Uncharacterized protein n=1 Tax=Chitinophaga skermanii TaxID=331697 RepID=A0A327Q234_9BACT|nr:hypothetical protein [Chitinophaga skermanii]RAI98409.1 hypothetical protein LX64_04771 [Chitinophaga skermanii]
MGRFTAAKFFKILVCGVAFVAVMGSAIKYLWNWLMPTLFNLPLITFWQALGLFILCKLLFGGMFGGGPKGSWKDKKLWRDKMAEKMKNMSPEEREKMREKLGKCWSHRGPWGEQWRHFEDELKNNPSNTDTSTHTHTETKEEKPPYQS